MVSCCRRRTTLKAGGVVLREAFALWHRSLAPTAPPLPSRRAWIDDCPLPCNTDRSVCAPLQ